MNALRKLGVVAIVAMALMLAACSSAQTVPPTTQHGVTPTTTAPNSTTSTTRPLPTIDLSATPAGWVPVDLGDAQVSAPRSWWSANQSILCPLGPEPGEIFVNPLPGVPQTCPPETAVPATTVSLEFPTVKESPARIARGHRSVINGIPLYSYAGPWTSYLAPSLGVEVSIHGPLGQRVLHTLTRSPLDVVLAPGAEPHVPSAWRTETAFGISFSVPKTWRTVGTGDVLPPSQALCSFSQVMQFRGVVISTDENVGFPTCHRPLPELEPPRDGVQIEQGMYQPSLVGPSGPCLHFHRITACSSKYSDYLYSILGVSVMVPGNPKPVIMNIGLAGNGIIARTILYSLRAA
jgi:hypothetical protein